MAETPSPTDYLGVTFINFQSSSPDQPTMQVMECLEKTIIALNKERIRCYINYQVGKPVHPCGGPGQVPCQ